MDQEIKTVIQYPVGATEFDIPFDYLSRKFVRVSLVADDNRRLLSNITEYRYVSKTRVKILVETTGFNRVEIRRFTSASERIVDFSDGSVLRATDLNVSQIQSAHIAEESRDAALMAMPQDDAGNLDARNRRIVRLAPGVDGSDAVNKNQLDTTLGEAGGILSEVKAEKQDFYEYLEKFADDTAMLRGVVWVYNSGSATGGETSVVINKPTQVYSVPYIEINGDRQEIGYQYDFDVTTQRITLAKPLVAGDFLMAMTTESKIPLESLLAGTKGASSIGTSDGSTVQESLDGIRKEVDDITLYSVKGDDPAGLVDSTQAFNSTIEKLAKAGGGILKPTVGTYKIIGSILLPSWVTLDLRGVKLRGSGSNTLIKAGAIVGGKLIDITPEWGTGNTGNGTNFVWGAAIVGGSLGNALVGIRGHRLNNGTHIRDVTFESTLGTSWDTTHSWGLNISTCTVNSPALMRDFVDWTTIQGCTFEGNNGYNDNYAAITVGTGGYGGSYSLRLIGNGFHRMHIGVRLNCEMANCVIESNHFEATVKHIVGNNDDKRHFRIKNNWMKANLTSAQQSAPSVTPMTFGFLRDSEIGPNRFSHDRGPDYDFYINAAGSNVFGNKVFVGYKTDEDYSRWNLNAANHLEAIRGSNSPATAFPEVDIRGGNGTYTLEKYVSKYNLVPNKIPKCTVSYTGTTVTIETWIPWSDNPGGGGCGSFAQFNIRVAGSSRTVRAMGRFGWKTVVADVNVEEYGGADKVTLSLSKSQAGNVQLIVDNAPIGGSITGWIKEL